MRPAGRTDSSACRLDLKSFFGCAFPLDAVRENGGRSQRRRRSRKRGRKTGFATRRSYGRSRASAAAKKEDQNAATIPTACMISRQPTDVTSFGSGRGGCAGISGLLSCDARVAVRVASMRGDRKRVSAVREAAERGNDDQANQEGGRRARGLQSRTGTRCNARGGARPSRLSRGHADLRRLARKGSRP